MSDEKPVFVGGAGKVRIKRWDIIGTFPLFGVARLHGLVYDHPRFEDGEEVVSSPIVEMNLLSRIVKTHSGRVYHLEDPHPDFIEWLEKRNYTEDLNKLFPN
jgi:hypothetical protein